MSLVTVRAVSSCCESATWSRPKLGLRTPWASPFWIACWACFLSPIRLASWRTIGRRSRMTLPFCVEIDLVVALRGSRPAGCGRRGSRPSRACCTRGDWNACWAARVANSRTPAASGSRERLEVGRQLLLQDPRDVDVRVELVDGVDGDGVRDLLVLRAACRWCRPTRLVSSACRSTQLVKIARKARIEARMTRIADLDPVPRLRRFGRGHPPPDPTPEARSMASFAASELTPVSSW